MSTGSQLRFVQRVDHETDGGGTETTERIAPIYRHSDGSPEAVVPDLRRLKCLLDMIETERGPDYPAAQLVFLDKLQAMGDSVGTDRERSVRANEPEALTDPASFEYLNQPRFLLGHGIEDPSNGIHGNEAYRYVVVMPAVAFGELSEWSVKVSEHEGLPRGGRAHRAGLRAGDLAVRGVTHGGRRGYPRKGGLVTVAAVKQRRCCDSPASATVLSLLTSV